MFFTNSGAEALECSIKMARKYHAAKGHPERYRLITFEGAFHGRTLATIAAGGQAKYLEGFGPKVEGFDQVPFGDLAALEAAIGAETAGILIEPIQGEGGIRPVPPVAHAQLRELCDEHGILLVLDEVQCGIGRTGKLFAHEWAGITPDIMAIAKGIGGGFPLGACLAHRKGGARHDGRHPWLDLWRQSAGHGGRQCGARCGSGRRVSSTMCARPGLALKQKLARLKDEHPDDHRRHPRRRPDDGDQVQGSQYGVRAAALGEKLLTIGAGDNVIRLLPPLIVTDDDIAEAVERA